MRYEPEACDVPNCREPASADPAALDTYGRRLCRPHAADAAWVAIHNPLVTVREAGEQVCTLALPPRPVLMP